ncbi:MAG: transposase [Mycoplasmataceae bacterium RC_NB112A]|nr:MAG: transposase [Mycoplasmataceae bacterium RC_NB112A]
MSKAKSKGIKTPTPQHLKSLKQRGYTYKTIATVYGVSEKTVRNWKKKDDKPKKETRGRKSKINGKLLYDLSFLLSGQGSRKSYTHQKMADYLSRKAGEKISRLSVLRALKKTNFTRKKLTNHYSEQLDHARKISKFKKLIPNLPQSCIIAIDECGFHLNETPRYGYAKQGSRAGYLKPGYPGNNHTLILCIQNVVGKGVIHWELIKGGMKTEHFHKFLTDLKLPSEAKHYLIMDNLPVHKAKQSCIKLNLTPIKELLVSKNIEVLYLPPYTPEMNPVEYCFNFIRQQVEKNKPRTFEKLKEVIAKIINILNQKDLTEYFRHCQDYKHGESVNNSGSDMTFWRWFIKGSSAYKNGNYFWTL